MVSHCRRKRAVSMLWRNYRERERNMEKFREMSGKGKQGKGRRGEGGKEKREGFNPFSRSMKTTDEFTS